MPIGLKEKLVIQICTLKDVGERLPWSNNILIGVHYRERQLLGLRTT